MLDNRGLFDEQHRLKEEFTHSFYQIIYVTLFVSVFSFLIPTFSLTTFSFYLILFIACFCWRHVTDRYKLYRSVKWRVGSLIGHLDVSAIFVGIVFWRVSGKKLSIIVLLLATLTIAIGIGHYFRRVITQELRKPLTKWGKVIASVSVVGAGNSALLAYFLSRFTTINVLALLMYSLILIIVVIVHSLWIYVEEQNWVPKER